MKNIGYIMRRILTRWKRTRLVSDYLARQLLFRFLSSVPILSPNENVSPKPFVPSTDARILVLGPHSDDESIACGGLLASFPNQSSVICLTDGSLADPHVPKEQLVAVREKELSNAMQIAGVNRYHFLRAPDQGLTDSYALFDQLDLSVYDYIFLPNFLDQHPDHKAVTHLLQQWLGRHKYAAGLQIGFYEVWGAMPVWNSYITLDNALLMKKRQMINCFASQIKHINYAARIEGLHTYRGIAVDKPMVEAFMLLSAADFLAIDSGL